MKIEKCYFWPTYLSLVLNKVEQKRVQKILPDLKIAQVFLWRALNIYDDILDKENKETDLLKANNYYRRFLAIHYRLNLPKDYYQKLDKTFSRLEKINKKEIETTKITIKDGKILVPKNPKPIISKQNLADKSAVLTLFTNAMFFYLKKPALSLDKFWNYFLSAKQLADDSYDWFEDLKKGIITNANYPLLKIYQGKTINLSQKKKLQTLFEKYCVLTMIKEISRLCLKAEKEIDKFKKDRSKIIKNKLLKPLLTACRSAEKSFSLKYPSNL